MIASSTCRVTLPAPKENPEGRRNPYIAISLIMVGFKISAAVAKEKVRLTDFRQVTCLHGEHGPYVDHETDPAFLEWQ